eukprot:Transcript_24200.p1 GENE.Transcript_24200~~Transcript_24200.p1  ORF type:complete len:86 (-),score=8.19 Transcript_24200:79-336(-)
MSRHTKIHRSEHGGGARCGGAGGGGRAQSKGAGLPEASGATPEARRRAEASSSAPRVAKAAHSTWRGARKSPREEGGAGGAGAGL